MKWIVIVGLLALSGCIGKGYPTTIATFEEKTTIWTGYHSPCGIKHYRYVVMTLVYDLDSDSVTRTRQLFECDCEGIVEVENAVDMIGMGFNE